jgi:hypothetical protein
VVPGGALAPALLTGTGAALGLAEPLGQSKAERHRLAGIADGPAVTPDLDRPAARRLLYRIGAELFRDLALLAWAGAVARGGGGGGGRVATEPWLALLELAAGWAKPVLLVRGAGALALGLAHAPRSAGSSVRSRPVVDRG